MKFDFLKSRVWGKLYCILAADDLTIVVSVWYCYLNVASSRLPIYNHGAIVSQCVVLVSMSGCDADATEIAKTRFEIRQLNKRNHIMD